MMGHNGRRGLAVRRSASEVATIFRHAFSHCLTVTKTSKTDAARWMGVQRYTVQRYLSGKGEVNAKFIFRSDRLWRPFWLCVGKLMREVRGNGSKRTAPRMARARKGRY